MPERDTAPRVDLGLTRSEAVAMVGSYADIPLARRLVTAGCPGRLAVQLSAR